MEIRAWSPKFKKYEDMEPCIFRAWSPEHLKRSRCRILDLWSRSGCKVLNLLRHSCAKSLFSGRKIPLMDEFP